MSFWEGAGGALLGAMVGGITTYFGQRRLDSKRQESDAALRAHAMAEERAAGRDSQSRAAAIDALEALWVLATSAPVLRYADPLWSRGVGRGLSDQAVQARASLDRIRHAVAVDGPQLVLSALRQQLEETSLLANEYAYGRWYDVGTEEAGDPQAARSARLNGGLVDFQRFVAWTTKMFEAYVDESWSSFSFEPRPALSRSDLGSWEPPDERS